MYHFLYNCVFCLAFINFLIYWINLFFSENKASPIVENKPVEWEGTQTNNKINNNAYRPPPHLIQAKQPTRLTLAEALPIRLNFSTVWDGSGANSIDSIELRNRLFRQWPQSFFNWLSKIWIINQLKAVVWRPFKTHRPPLSFITCSLLWFALTLLILFRITQSNHFPLANFYEALIFLTWCLVTLNFIILLEPTGKKKSVDLAVSQKSLSKLSSFSSMTGFYEEPSVQKQVSGAILAPCILFIIAFAQFHLSSDVTPLVPALKSNWLLMHVSIMICSYTTFIIGGLLSIILLMQTFFSNSTRLFFNKSSDQFWNNKNKTLFMNYPWFQKNSIETEWPSFSQLSYTNSEVGSGNQFLKGGSLEVENQMYLSEKSEQVYQPFLFNALEKKRFHILEDVLKHKERMKTGNKGTPDVDISNPGPTRVSSFVHPNFDMSKSGCDFQEYNFSQPLENLKLNKTTNRQWEQNLEPKTSPENWGFPAFDSVLEGSSKMQKKNFYIILDNLSYRMIGIGFPLFTLGILSGAVWANEAWGSYWSWDIKEVGSFINWLLVALYFHCRYKNFISLSHIVAFISLMALFFNFFGISLGIFGSSLHAYGASS